MALNRGIGVSLTKSLRKLTEDLDSIRSEFLKGLSEEVVLSSPVDTGTYVMSHNVGESSAAGRFTGNIRYIGPPGRDRGSMQQEALSKMYAQIDSLPKEQTRVNLSNNSAHAYIVEDGGFGWITSPYKIYATARNRAPIILQKAIDKVRGSQ